MDCMRMSKASFTVEASFVMIITLFVILAIVMLSFQLYWDNYELYKDGLEEFQFDAVDKFRRIESIWK